MIKRIKYLLPLLAFLSCNNPNSNAQSRELPEQKKIQFPKSDLQTKWVDSVYNSLTLDQKIGQLFMVAAYSGGKNYNEANIKKLIQDNHIGGVIFMQGTAEAQANLTNAYQKLSKVPMLIGMDAEWGLGMRLSGIHNYPRQMTLGASRSEKLVYDLGKNIAEQCKLLGVHINFAPDIDVNNNPHNPVINFRSFGEDKDWVSRLGIAYMNGMQDNGIFACGKHFPGHCDVSTDSHLDLPVSKKSKSQLDSIELYPFRKLINAGVYSMMIAHLNVPALEMGNKLPTTLSIKTVTDLLKKEMGFKGLIFTDALNMEGVAKYHAVGEVDLKAFIAGNDVLLFSQNVPLAVQKIKAAVNDKRISEERLAESVKKILRAKYDAGLPNFKPIDTKGLDIKLNKGILDFQFRAANESITLVKNNNDIVTKLANSKVKTAYLGVNGNSSAFFNLLKQKFANCVQITSVAQAANYDVVIVGVHGLSLYPGKAKNYSISAASSTVLKQLGKNKNTIIVHFGNAYGAKNYCNSNSLLINYEENSGSYDATINVLTGKSKAIGVLPIQPCQ